MPDCYYDGDPCGGPDTLTNTAAMTALGHVKGRPSVLWECCAGSGKLSAWCKKEAVTHLPPIDFRWGFDMRILRHQIPILYAFLVYGCEMFFVSPNCTPWGNNARQWTPEKRKQRRVAEGKTLQFVAVLCFLQVLLGRCYVVEKPQGSEIFSPSST